MDKLYPAGPASVPDDLARPTESYRRQAWLAGAGLSAFIVLYAALAGWFVWTSYRLLHGAFNGGDNPLVSGLIGLCAGFLAVFMLKALVFVKRGSTGNDPEITAQQQPDLFAFLYRLADETGAPRPHKVYLSGDVNAAVFYDLSIANLVFPSRKNLVIGLPLVNVLTLGELKAVLAHEFGHFAQRSMAIGIWVYIAHQIAAHVIAHRDALDRFLNFLSRVDLRVAWIGWILRLIVWSIRSLLDTVLRLMLLAQRALSREMEFQADLVSVSVTGSDALIHALHKLRAADEAWDRARQLALAESRSGHRVRNVFGLQTRAIEKIGVILSDPHYGRVPPVPTADPGQHRVFKVGLAQPPRMWSTHPESSDREKNAKKRYIPAPLDERSAWELFRDPQTLQSEFCDRWFPPQRAGDAPPATETAEPSTADLQAALERQLGRIYLQPDYRGAYLGRSPVRHVARVADLYGKPTDAAMLAQELAGLYPASLADRFAQLRQLEEEKIALHGLLKGTMSAPDGVVKHRGEEISRRQLPDVIASVDREADALRDSILEHDRRCRTLHMAAAQQAGRGWPEYLRALAAVLHYADHAEANLRDAQGVLGNVYAVVTADGKVSGKELKRLLKACNDLHRELAGVYGQAAQVRLDGTLLARMEITDWSQALGELQLPAATEANIGQWLGAIDSWVNSAAAGLSSMKLAALEQLLTSEAHIARAVHDGTPPDAAPAPSQVPAEYPVLLPGNERERQTQLGWWDRFQTADGAIAATLRVTVALAIVTGVIVLATGVGSAELHVYNGLGRTVAVAVDDQSFELAPLENHTLTVKRGEHTITARTTGGVLIESFEAEADDSSKHWIYNVAGAAPLVAWTAVYGDLPEVPEETLGLARWTEAEADLFFEEPPEKVEVRDGSRGATRRVVYGFAHLAPRDMLGLAPTADDQLQLALRQARWVTTMSPHAEEWMQLVAGRKEFRDMIEQRLQENPRDPLALPWAEGAPAPADADPEAATEPAAI